VEREIYTNLFELEDTHWWFQGRRAVVWSLLKKAGIPPHARILDAGCGTGRNLIEFGGLGDAVGIEPSTDAIAFCAERGLTAIAAGVEDLPFEDDRFDLVLMLDVLEHISDDGAALRELRRVAKPGGALVLTVPAHQYLWSQHDETHHHFRRYTQPQLRELLEMNAWRPAFTTYFNTTLLAPIAAMRLVAPRLSAGSTRNDYEVKSDAVNRVLTGIMTMEAGLISKGARFPTGVSIGAVCHPR
jgi:SAM-dependent methyltransferase